MLIESIRKEKAQLRKGGKREAKLEVAKLMLQSGEPIEKIKRYTRISEATLLKFMQKLPK